jgi:hypothetical protein
MGKADFPLQIVHPETIIPRLDTQTSLFVGGMWGSATSGQTWMASDGKRFIWSADGLQVVYSLDGKFFTQSARGFVNEVRTYPAVAAARNSQFWATAAQTEVKLLMGIVAGASGVGFAIVVGLEITEFVVENREDFSKWENQLETCWKARAILKVHCPVLYDKVFSAVLNRILKDVWANLPDSVTPQVVFFGIGVIIGSVGKKVASGKFTWAALIFVVVEQLAIRLITGVVPQAIKITESEYRKMADEIIRQLQTAGVALQDGDMRKIVQEVQDHPDEVRKAFDLMKNAFEKETVSH